MKKTTVLIVDDSASSRELLAYIISRSSNLEVIGAVDSGEKALQFIEHHRPDVITMDIVMPKMDGFETARRILEKMPIPIVVISSNFNAHEIDKSFQAIDAGCVAILEKPIGVQDPTFPEVCKRIIETVSNMSEVKLVTRRHKRSPTAPLPLPAPSKTEICAVAIGASLGGPQALQTILSKLPQTFPVPIFLVQHISHGFIKGYVDWLQSSTSLQVKLAEHGYLAKGGEVLVAPDNFHLEVARDNRIMLIEGKSNETLCPSVSRLFYSMAQTHGERGIGVILTGMGRDGVTELKLMRDKGALTIAQDQEGCIMYGMPKEAIESKAAKESIPLDRIADALIVATRTKKLN